MSIDNTEICNTIKDAISFIKEDKYSEAIKSLESIRSKLTERQESGFDVINEIVESLERKDKGGALHFFQVIINKTGCKGLIPWMYQNDR